VEVMQLPQRAAGRGPEETRQPRDAGGRETRIQPSVGAQAGREKQNKVYGAGRPIDRRPRPALRTMTFPPALTRYRAAHDALRGRSAVRDAGAAMAATHAPTPQPR